MATQRLGTRNHLAVWLVTTLIWLASLTSPLWASPFTTTVPGTSIIIPTTYPQAGGIVIVLEGTNGNIYYQFANPSTMFQGFQNSGTPATFNGNPFQIAPSAALNCGISTCSTYLGGGITRVSIRFTAYDGDNQLGMFDYNDLTLRLNGFNVGNWSPVATQNTSTDGTIVNSSNTGFGNNTFDTGWFQTTDPALLSNILSTGSLTSTVFDNDPNDNFWDFRRGADANTSTVPLTVAPGFTIDKTSDTPTYSTVGQVVTYNYLVTNIGSVYIDNLSVTDNKIGTVSCTPTIIYPSAGPTGKATCTKTYTITQANIDAGSITNSATATGTPQAGSLGSASDSLTITGPTAAPSMQLIKSAAPNPFGAVGSSIIYTFSIKNTGNVTLTNAAITDALLPSLSCTSGSIAPGVTQALSCTGNSRIITQSDVDNGAILNTATGSARSPSGATVNANGSVNTAGPAQVHSISIAKSASVATYNAVGTVVTYSYTVTNTGNVTLTTPITVSDDKIASVSCPPLPGGGLAPNAPLVCSASYTISQTDLNNGSLTNTASAASGATATTISAVKTINAVQNPALTIEKQSSTSSFDAIGDMLSYSYLITNSGNITLTSAITISDNKIASISCPPLPDAGGTMDPGSFITCTATYSATQADLDAGGVTNTASASSGATNSPNDSFTVPAVQTRSLSLVKTPTSVAFSVPGDVVTYDYLVTNTGNVTLAGPFTINDNRIAPANISCPSGNLSPGAQLTCTGTYTIVLDDLTLGSVTNVATATNGTTTSPQTSATVPTGAMPALSIEKSTVPALTSFNAVGDIISYSFTVTNSGNATFTRQVDVIDDKIGTIACFTPTIGQLVLIAGKIVTCSDNYTVTQADLDAGLVTNQAFAKTTFGGAGPVGTIPVTSPPDAVTVNAAQTPHMLVTKSVATLPISSVGQVLTYTIAVKNDGNVTLSYINFIDPLIPSLSCAIASLPVGSTNASCTGTYSVRQADFDAGVINNTASVLGITPQGANVSASGSLATPINQTSTISVVKSLSSNADEDGSSTISLDDTLTYAVVVTNTGNISQTNVMVSDAKLAPSSLTCITLSPGASCTLAGSYTVSQTDVDAGTIGNTGAATTTLITSPVTHSITTNVPQNSSLVIAKAVTSSGAITLGTVISYDVTATNNGNITQGNVVVSDNKITPSTITCASLAPAATCVLSGSHTVTQAELDAGSVDNTASVTSTLLPVPETTTLSTPVTQVSSLAISKSIVANNDADGSGSISLNDTLTYEVIATNNGSITQSNVTVSDAKITPNSIVCGSLLPAGSCLLSGTYVVSQADVDAGTIGNTGSVTSTLLPTPQPVTLATPIVQNSSLNITKVQTATGPFVLGASLSYDITVTNDGNVTQTNVIIVDTKITPDTITCAMLLPSQTCILSGTHNVTQADVDAGTVDNSASVASTLLPTPEAIAVSTPIAQVSALAITKSQTTNDDADGSGAISLGDTLTYLVSVTNSGTVTQDNVDVTDPKITPNNVVCVTLTPAALCTLTGTYMVTQADIDTGTINNTATVTSTRLPTAQTVSVSTLVVQNSSLTIAKVLTSSGPFALGSVLVYEVTATNNGNVSQSDVIVTDTKITSSSLTCATLLPGASCTLAGSYTVSQMDVDAGTIGNTGGVTSTLLPTSETVTISTPVAQTSSLFITKTMETTGSLTVGTVLTYEVNAVNDGTVTQSNVVVSDGKITPNTITCASVAPTATCTLLGTYIITQADMDAGHIDNSASVTSTLLPTPETVSLTTPLVQNGSLSIAKTLVTTGPLSVGQSLIYNVTAINDGNLTQTNVTVSDSKISPNSITCASLDPSETCILTGSYTLTQADMDAGVIDNTGSVISTLLSTPESTTLSTVIPQISALEATKTIVSAGRHAGELVTYQITVENTGNVTLGSIGLTDAMTRAGGGALALTSGPTFISSDGGSAAGSLLPNETATYSATYGLVAADIAAGGILNSATVTGISAPTLANPNPLAVSDVSDNGNDLDGNTVNDPTNLPLDPSGVIYSSATGLPVSGVTVFLTDAAGTALPAACLLPSQQAQITGATGEYRFDIITGGAPACPAGETLYRLRFTPPSGYLSAISKVYPPQAGSVDATTCPIDAIPGGLCQVSASDFAPPIGTTFPYYLSFLFAAGDSDVVNNHIPIDPNPVLAAGNLTVEKTADVRIAHRGDVVTYTIVVRNETLTAVGPLSVVDTLPASFLFVSGSATFEGATVVPASAGHILTFAGLTIPPRSERTIKLAVRIATNVALGDHANLATAENPATGENLSNIAKALVRIEAEAVFDCADIIGKVFDDQNGSGYQDKGEPGMPGVRLASVKGTLITTDKNGQFHVPCPELPDAKIGTNFLLKLDIRTLPDGYAVTTENPRMVRLTAGKMTKLNFGATKAKTIRIDLDSQAFGSGSLEYQHLLDELRPVFQRYANQPVAVQLTYRSTKSEGGVAAKITARIEDEIRHLWGDITKERITVETRLVVSK